FDPSLRSIPASPRSTKAEMSNPTAAWIHRGSTSARPSLIAANIPRTAQAVAQVKPPAKADAFHPVRMATWPNARLARTALAIGTEEVALRVKTIAKSARTHAWNDNNRVSRSDRSSKSQGSSFHPSALVNRPAICATASAAIAVAKGKYIAGV